MSRLPRSIWTLRHQLAGLPLPADSQVDLQQGAQLFTSNRVDDDLRDELEAHLEMETAEYIRRGMRPDEARRQALLFDTLLDAVVITDLEGRIIDWNPAAERLTASNRTIGWFEPV